MQSSQQLKKEVRLLTTTLGQIIKEQEDPKVFETIEKLRLVSKAIRKDFNYSPEQISKKLELVYSLDQETAYKVVHAFGLFFQLVNLSEERARRRAIQENDNLRQSLSAMFKDFLKDDVNPKKIQQCLDQMEIEPVLTAHPTESKRRTISAQLLRISESFDDLEEVLETLWRAKATRSRRITPLDELNNCLFYFKHTIFKAFADYRRVFNQELNKAYPSLKVDRCFLRIGNWVGGDRDGNPFVTTAVSLKAMKQQHQLAVSLIQDQLNALVSELCHATPELNDQNLKESYDDPFHKDEIIRRKVLDLSKRVKVGFSDEKYLLSELKEIQKSLLDIGANRSANGRIQDLIYQVETFGLVLAHLDFRDHSSKLEHSREEIIDQFRTIKEIQDLYGLRAAHRFILSMTNSSEKILDLLSCAYKAGCRNIDIVPLFETVNDLENAPKLLESLLSNAKYQKHLAKRDHVQEIMLGYSDSSKDGGYFAANWHLHTAEQKLSRCADRNDIKLRLFHGKGGTIDRGGGMSYRSLMAQPFASHGARIRITEQGEVVSLKYAHSLIARRNLEQMTTGIMDSFCRNRERDTVDADMKKMMNVLSKESRKTFRHLVYETPEFNEYFYSATPVDFVSELYIGSRPASRKLSRTMDYLRAIPWVFSWTQSRHLLSAWYGIGSALKAAMVNKEDVKTLRKMYREWPFFSMLIDNASISLAKADLYIMRLYASLVEDESIREKILGLIEEEYGLTLDMITKVKQSKELLDNSRLSESIDLRNPYVDPLHYMQVRLLKDWRSATDPKEREQLRELLAMTVKGIAFGMKATG